MRELAMFPLGTVLIPGGFLPLRVFEPRYLQMLEDILPDPAEFGVVLIERGSEVGGGDTRNAVGTLAKIAEARHGPDGHWALVVFGRERIRVVRWLEDDPYPRAMVESWPDPPEGVVPSDVVEEVLVRLRRVLALRAEAGLPGAPIDVKLPADDELLSLFAASAAGCGPADLQRLLCVESTGSRLAECGTLLEEQQTLLEGLLAEG
jgi:hypothetical protein